MPATELGHGLAAVISAVIEPVAIPDAFTESRERIAQEEITRGLRIFGLVLAGHGEGENARADHAAAPASLGALIVERAAIVTAQDISDGFVDVLFWHVELGVLRGAQEHEFPGGDGQV